MSVEVPLGALGGDSDVANLSLVSQFDPSTTAAAVLSSSANFVYAPGLTPPGDAAAGDPGTTLTYTLSLTNLGNGDDSFDVSLSGNSWTASAPATVGPLAPGASESLAVAVSIPAGALSGDSDLLTVTAASQADPAATAVTTLESSASTVFGVAADPASQAKTGAVSTTVSYSVTVSNTGNLTDTFKLKLSGNNWTTTAPASITIGPYSSGVVGVNVEVPAQVGTGANDTATLSITSQGDTGVNTQVEMTTTGVVPADLGLEKTVSAATVSVGAQLDYTLTVQNNSASVAAVDIVLTDTLPAGMTFVSASNPACTLVDNQVVCDLGGLAGGDSAVVVITVTAGAPGTLVNQAQVTALNDITPENNFASASAEVLAQLKLFLPLVVK